MLPIPIGLIQLRGHQLAPGIEKLVMARKARFVEVGRDAVHAQVRGQFAGAANHAAAQLSATGLIDHIDRTDL